MATYKQHAALQLAPALEKSVVTARLFKRGLYAIIMLLLGCLLISEGLNAEAERRAYINDGVALIATVTAVDQDAETLIYTYSHPETGDDATEEVTYGSDDRRWARVGTEIPVYYNPDMDPVSQPRASLGLGFFFIVMGIYMLLGGVMYASLMRTNGYSPNVWCPFPMFPSEASDWRGRVILLLRAMFGMALPMPLLLYIIHSGNRSAVGLALVGSGLIFCGMWWHLWDALRSYRRPHTLLRPRTADDTLPFPRGVSKALQDCGYKPLVVVDAISAPFLRTPLAQMPSGACIGVQYMYAHRDGTALAEVVDMEALAPNDGVPGDAHRGFFAVQFVSRLSSGQVIETSFPFGERMSTRRLNTRYTTASLGATARLHHERLHAQATHQPQPFAIAHPFVAIDQRNEIICATGRATQRRLAITVPQMRFVWASALFGWVCLLIGAATYSSEAVRYGLLLGGYSVIVVLTMLPGMVTTFRRSVKQYHYAGMARLKYPDAHVLPLVGAMFTR